jgi:hypothetical protein
MTVLTAEAPISGASTNNTFPTNASRSVADAAKLLEKRQWQTLHRQRKLQVKDLNRALELGLPHAVTGKPIKLHPNGLRVAEYVIFHYHGDPTIIVGSEQGCIAKQEDIANALGLSRKAVNEWLAFLVDAGIFSSERRNRVGKYAQAAHMGGRSTNRYLFLWDRIKDFLGAAARAVRRGVSRVPFWADNQSSRAGVTAKGLFEPSRNGELVQQASSKQPVVDTTAGPSQQSRDDGWSSFAELLRKHHGDEVAAEYAAGQTGIETKGVGIEHEQNGKHEGASEAESGTRQSPGPSRRAVARQRDAGYRGGHPRSERGRDAACSSGANRLCHRLGGLRIRTFPLHLARLRLSQKAGFPGPLAMMLRARRVARRRLSDESRIPNLAPFDSVARLVR